MQAVIEGAASRPLAVQVRPVPVLRPFVWVARGLTDLVRCRRPDFAHALLIVVFCSMLLLLGAHPYFLAAALSGFLLGAPVMTTGLVELSRRRESGEPTTFNDSMAPLERNGPALVRFGVILAGFAAGWFVVVDAATRVQLFSYLVMGAVLALLVIVLFVVTVPAIIDLHASVGQAMSLSIDVIRASPLAMVVWAALLATCTAIGITTLLLGMVAIIPLLAHATWHAYRDLVHR